VCAPPRSVPPLPPPFTPSGELGLCDDDLRELHRKLLPAEHVYPLPRLHLLDQLPYHQLRFHLTKNHLAQKTAAATAASRVASRVASRGGAQHSVAAASPSMGAAASSPALNSLSPALTALTARSPVMGGVSNFPSLPPPMPLGALGGSRDSRSSGGGGGGGGSGGSSAERLRPPFGGCSAAAASSDASATICSVTSDEGTQHGSRGELQRGELQRGELLHAAQHGASGWEGWHAEAPPSARLLDEHSLEAAPPDGLPGQPLPGVRLERQESGSSAAFALTAFSRQGVSSRDVVTMHALEAKAQAQQALQYSPSVQPSVPPHAAEVEV